MGAFKGHAPHNGQHYNFFFLLRIHLFCVIWREELSLLTPHDGRRHSGLGGIRTYVHLHGSPALYHCATGVDNFFLTGYNLQPPTF